MPRLQLQRVLEQENESWFAEYARAIDDASKRPDGDVQLDDSAIDEFALPARVPGCRSSEEVDERTCGGHLKPSVVFFGGTIARDVQDRALHLASTCDTLLVLGTTLSTHSGLRLVRAAADQPATRIVLVNFGPTRADALLAALGPTRARKIEADLLGVVQHITRRNDS